MRNDRNQSAVIYARMPAPQVVAPIAVGYYPYNRCDVWLCSSCRRAYLRYTEYGGYYEDERVRLFDPALIVWADS